jgi:hypothetical protein
MAMGRVASLTGAAESRAAGVAGAAALVFSSGSCRGPAMSQPAALCIAKMSGKQARDRQRVFSTAGPRTMFSGGHRQLFGAAR